jgi:signal transduction histidine kinase
MFRVIDDLIEASAIESGEPELVLAPTDILELIRENLSLNRLSAERKQIRMDLSSAGDLPLISLDPPSISRVVNKLLTKSIQSSRPGGRIEIHVGIEEQQAIISVRSEKSFLSADELRFLSNSYQGGRRGLPKANPGEIIAFRMVNKIVERHGGAFRVECDAGKGLTFILALPIAVGRVLSGHA